MNLKKLIRMPSILKFILILIFMLVIFTCLALGLADLGIRYQADIYQLRMWMRKTWFLWFVWRLIIYSAIGWGIWRIYRSPTTSQSLRQSLIRISVASVGFAAVCEYSVLR